MLSRRRATALELPPIRRRDDCRNRHVTLGVRLRVWGYRSASVLDSVAARRAEALRYFAYFRPLQMLLPTLSFVILLTRTGAHHPSNPPAPQSDALWTEPIALIEPRDADEAPSLRDVR